MKLSIIISAIVMALMCLIPVDAATADVAPAHHGLEKFTFVLPVVPGLPHGPGPAATITVNLSGLNSTSLAQIANATAGHFPSPADMATIHDQVKAYILAVDGTRCGRDCCIALCFPIIWIPIVGIACGMSIVASFVMMWELFGPKPMTPLQRRWALQKQKGQKD